MSRTKDALTWMLENKVTAYVAAEKFGITASTIYAAARKQRCPCCGNFLKSDQKLTSKGEVRTVKIDKPKKVEKIDPLLDV